MMGSAYKRSAAVFYDLKFEAPPIHDSRDKEKHDALSYNGIENSVNIANGYIASRRYEPSSVLLSVYCWL